MFLTTPTNGLKDLYFQAAYTLPADAIGMKSFTPSVIYHSYATDHLGAGIGSEWDAQGELVVDTNLSLWPNMPTIRAPALPSAASPTNPSSGSRQRGNIETSPFVCFGRRPSRGCLTP